MGLIVTELVINALKQAFDDDKTGGQIIAAYGTVETGWTLTVSDNGVGDHPRDTSARAPARPPDACTAAAS